MNSYKPETMSRRALLRRATGGAALASLFSLANPDAIAQRPADFNKLSAPSSLKITDMRACTIAANFDYPIIRIDTNQGVYGYGECFAGGFKGSALMLKSWIVGRNPLDIQGILNREGGLHLSAGHRFWNSGFGAIDLALHDIAGKVYGVPAWRLLGPKVRDRVLVYADTTGSRDPKIFQERMIRRQKVGFKFFKMDLGTGLVGHIPGAVNNGVATDKGLSHMCELIAAVRDAVGWDVPIAADHFGGTSAVYNAIRYARAFEPYQLAWAEDLIPEPWINWRAYKQIKEATTTPILTGEHCFSLKRGFKDLIDNNAVDIIHPDVVGSGGMLEIKKIHDYADANGMPTAIHMPGSPIGQMAMVHLAATLTNFVAVEHHAADMPWWQDLVTGVEKPIINDGYVTVPDTPGLGIELNEEAVRKHLRLPGYFEPTPEWDVKYITSGPFAHVGPQGGWPHYDDDGIWCDDCTR